MINIRLLPNGPYGPSYWRIAWMKKYDLHRIGDKPAQFSLTWSQYWVNGNYIKGLPIDEEKWKE